MVGQQRSCNLNVELRSVIVQIAHFLTDLECLGLRAVSDLNDDSRRVDLKVVRGFMNFAVLIVHKRPR